MGLFRGQRLSSVLPQTGNRSMLDHGCRLRGHQSSERGDGDSRRHSALCILHSASRWAPTKTTPSKTCVWRSRRSDAASESARVSPGCQQRWICKEPLKSAFPNSRPTVGRPSGPTRNALFNVSHGTDSSLREVPSGPGSSICVSESAGSREWKRKKRP